MIRRKYLFTNNNLFRNTMTKRIENNLFQNKFQVINEAEEHKFADDDEENKYEMPANQQCGSPYDSEFKSESADCKFT